MEHEAMRNHVQWACKRRGIADDKEAAELAGMLPQHLRALIANGRPRLNTLDRLAKAWNVSIADLALGPRSKRARPSEYGGKPDVGKRVKNIRSEKGLTWAEMARRLKTTPQSIRISLNTNNMAVTSILDFAQVLEIDPRELLT
jgi:transcriptional regulator with XRE-family HTH domain